jgi:hypothetical protein
MTESLDPLSNDPTATFVGSGDADILRLIVVLSLGMCDAVLRDLLPTDYACHRLFGPAVLARARGAGAGPELLEALNLASELDAVARLAPDALRPSIEDIQNWLVKALRKLPPGPLEGEKWLVTGPVP